MLDRRGGFLKGRLTPEQDQRAVAFLVEEAWRFAHEKFDPRCPVCRAGETADRKSCPKCMGSGRGASFSKLAFEKMAQRLIDWTRAEFGDSRYPNRPTLDSLDELVDATYAGHAGDDRKLDLPEQLQTSDDLTAYELAGVLEGIDELPPHAQWAMIELAAPLADDYISREDLAAYHGVSTAALEDRLLELAGALRIAA